MGLLVVACNRGSTGEVNVTHTTGAALGEDAGATLPNESTQHRTVPVGTTTGVGGTRAPGPAGDAGSRYGK